MDCATRSKNFTNNITLHQALFKMRSLLLFPLLSIGIMANAQTLVDSIPYPGMLNLNLWGIHVTPDTIFLGADGPGDIYFSDHDGNMLGSISTGYTYNHGLIKRESSYLIAEDYSASGAMLHEISLTGQLIDEWVFPPGITGPSGGIGDLDEAGGGAIWFTMYFPDLDTDPYAFAYKWIPGSTTFLDTVPLHGEQPYGIAVKGDTLFYVTDNLNGDQERIYAYDLTNEDDLFWFELPDTPIDNDQRPFGLHWDGNFLYLIANRQGGSAFAHQTIFIYDIDSPVGIAPLELHEGLSVHPNPATDRSIVSMEEVPANGRLRLIDAKGAILFEQRIFTDQVQLSVEGLQAGNYWLQLLDDDRVIARKKIAVIR
jgi:hypothetical protein